MCTLDAAAEAGAALPGSYRAAAPTCIRDFSARCTGISVNYDILGLTY